MKGGSFQFHWSLVWCFYKLKWVYSYTLEVYGILFIFYKGYLNAGCDIDSGVNVYMCLYTLDVRFQPLSYCQLSSEGGISKFVCCYFGH